MDNKFNLQGKEIPGEREERERRKREREEWERRFGNTGTGTALAAQAQEYGQKIADAANTARDYVTDKVVGDKFKDVQNMDYNEVANQAKDYARQNPGQAILISAAAGLIIGLLVRGGRR